MNFKIIQKLDELLKHNPNLMTDMHSMCQVINGTFNIELTDIDNNSIAELANTVDEAVLEKYFTKVWQAQTKKYKYSGLSIIDEINDMRPRSVIDIGCGYNEFKGKIDNLVGIDPWNPRADLQSTVEHLDSDIKYDVAICLGSINFGSTDKIVKEMTAVVDVVTDGGLLYFRVNPGEQHDAPEAKWIQFYKWDPTFISNIAKHLNCKLVMLRQDTGNRYFFVLKKK